MLCPEVTNFPPPKVVICHKINQNINTINEGIRMNTFYKSLVIACPDEIKIPPSIEEVITEDSDTYKLSECSLTEFVDSVFIESFVKAGRLYCLSADRNCIVKNCAAITPDGTLTLHIIDYIYQTIGLEGTKRPNNYYEVCIDLKHLKHTEKLKHGLQKLGNFDFHISWEPNADDICPSSVARYFHDKNIDVTVCSLKTKVVNPEITQIPSLEGVEIEDVVEWVGMVSHRANVNPTEPYISTYTEPESTDPLESNKIAILIVRGFLTPTIITEVCQKLSEYVSSRIPCNYWASISIQSEESLWRWNYSTPRMFQSYISSDNIFFTKEQHITYSIGQLKYS
ncbi:ribonuclease P protein subunit p40-like [Battus philenor]|uniref:ribonuclease P protein subunit p40-like n=1 Tax=Battus philenor TaxID=42288 RepID=UPI0035CFC525